MSAFTIGRRQLYILPTRVGWYFTLILIALFAIAVKFDNQAAFMMLFILASVGVMAMIYTHNNVIGLELEAQPANSIFLGETACFPVTVANDSEGERHAVWLLCDEFHKLLAFEPGQRIACTIKLPTHKRGYQACPPINLSSQFPIGIFFCWTKRFESGQRCLVYPRPLDLMPLPESSSSGSKQRADARVRVGAEDYAGMKAYQAGDRLRDIHWPSLAKTHKLVSIQYQDEAGSALSISWFDIVNHVDTEERLSQLCHWVQQAEQSGVLYQLEMPGHSTDYGSGTNHYHRCLKVLALWGNEQSSDSVMTGGAQNSVDEEQHA
ncbi:MAG: DUF58 domain-containing protein [Gammaproteobacteria bacterium]|nr:DUF58 domain-containing protein [Gammaproteobacteria bacterium]